MALAMGSPPCVKSSVLVVDDLRVNRMVLARIVRKLGFEVLEAENGVEAVDLFLREREGLAFIFLDLVMPVKDGYDTAREVRDLEQQWSTDRTPIVAYTAERHDHVTHDGQTVYAAVKKCGMDDMMCKPVSVSAVQQVLSTYVPSFRPSPSGPILEASVVTAPAGTPAGTITASPSVATVGSLPTPNGAAVAAPAANGAVAAATSICTASSGAAVKGPEAAAATHPLQPWLQPSAARCPIMNERTRAFLSRVSHEQVQAHARRTGPPPSTGPPPTTSAGTAALAQPLPTAATPAAAVDAGAPGCLQRIAPAPNTSSSCQAVLKGAQTWSSATGSGGPERQKRAAEEMSCVEVGSQQQQRRQQLQSGQDRRLCTGLL